MMPQKIEILDMQECTQSIYIKPKSMLYIQNGIKKRWDLVEAHDSVAILLYHTGLDSFVFVKQFRPSIYLKNSDGFTYELCAGIVDKDKSLEQIAREEIIEETGFDVPLSQIEKIASFFTAVGIAGGKQTLYAANIDESMRVSDGGGVDDEQIEVIYVPKDKAIDFMFDESIATTSGLMFSLLWYFNR